MISKLFKKKKKEKEPMCPMPKSPYLAKLGQLTESLPTWTRQYHGNGDRVVKLNALKGEITLYGLDKNSLGNVCISVMSAGTELDWHSHEQDEIFILLKGKQVICFEDGRTVQLFPGDYYKINAGENHSCIFPIKTINYTIGIPPIPELPNGGRFSDEPEKYGIE